MDNFSPNHKYKKNRDYNYESREISTQEILIIESQKYLENEVEKNLEKNQKLISERLFSLLKESPPGSPKKLDTKRESGYKIDLYNIAEICGITSYKGEELKSELVLVENFKVMAEYIYSLEKLGKISGKIKNKYKIFKVNNIRELGKIFGVEVEGKEVEDIYNEICEKLIF